MCGNYSSKETIQARKLFKGGNYMRKYGIYSAVVVVTYINALVVRVFLLIEKNIYGQASSDKNYLQKKKD